MTNNISYIRRKTLKSDITATFATDIAAVATDSDPAIPSKKPQTNLLAIQKPI
jgi:hypothetical protein